MSAGIGDNSAAPQLLESMVSRIEALEGEIAELNSDKSDVYKEAKDHGFDVAALREVIGRRRKRGKDPEKFDERATIVDLYLSTLEGFGSGLVRAREDGGQ